MHTAQKSHSTRYQLSLMAALAIGLFATVPAQADPTFEVSGGVLDGINGVVVDGSNYNVTFDLGTCVALFSGCTSPSDFTFGSTAADASSALASILSGGDGAFTGGIVGENSGGTDRLWTPDGLSMGGADVLFSVATITTSGSSFGTTNGMKPITTDLTPGGGLVWAVWSVPEPGTLFLFGAGLLGLGALRRRRNVKTANSLFGV